MSVVTMMLLTTVVGQRADFVSPVVNCAIEGMLTYGTGSYATTTADRPSDPPTGGSFAATGAAGPALLLVPKPRLLVSTSFADNIDP